MAKKTLTTLVCTCVTVRVVRGHGITVELTDRVRVEGFTPLVGQAVRTHRPNGMRTNRMSAQWSRHAWWKGAVARGSAPTPTGWMID